jgi:CBS domain containing-hemolysin-like protein
VTLATTLLLLGVVVTLQGFFSGSEIALVSADRIRLQAEAQAGRLGARTALAMLARPTRTLGACLLGTNLCVIAAATLGAGLVAEYFDAPGWVAALIVTPITLTFGEMVPKAVYQHHADRIAPVVALPLHVFGRILWPLLKVLELIGRAFEREEDTHVSREDIRLLLDGAKEEALTASDKDLIRRVFAFSEARVLDAMVPLIDVVGVPEETTIADTAARMTESGHSRVIVYRERIDRISGVVFHHDVLAAEDWSHPVSTIARAPLFVPELKSVEQLLPAMRDQHHQIAVAVDEYGGSVGIITVEDVLEELVGEIEDETDQARSLVRRVSEREWIALGRAEREHLEQACGLRLPDGEFETLAGFMLGELGRVPARGERLEWGGFLLVVSKATDRAILEVSVRVR